MTHSETPPEIFNRTLRRIRRDRAFAGFSDSAFLIDHMRESILERLEGVQRTFRHALDLGSLDGSLGTRLREQGMSVVAADASFRFAQSSRGVQCDEDRLPFANASFDLVVSAGGLDQVNDLPGALALIRRVLKPDGLFMGAMIGAGSLRLLRALVMAADNEVDGSAVARFHPQIDVRSGGDLLARAGFALPVADGERLDVRYANPIRMMSDLRGMAMSNLLADQGPPALSPRRLSNIMARFGERADADGRATETFEFVFLTGWSPGPDQPAPAKRGSGKVSLSEALKPRSD